MTDKTEAKGAKEAAVVDAARRRFLAGAAALTTVSLAPGVVLIAGAEAKPADQPASASGNRWGMLIDVNKCDEACDACVTACVEEQGLQGHGRPETDPQWLRKVNLRDPATGAEKSLPVMCQHCENPPCVDVCPTGASFKRGDGIVLVDRHICIGCRYCMMACPYKARSFVHEPIRGQKMHMPRGKGCVEGCTLCVHRVDAGGLPACVEACPTGAMVFGDLNDADSAISKALAQYGPGRIRADLGTEPKVFYEGL